MHVHTIIGNNSTYGTQSAPETNYTRNNLSELSRWNLNVFCRWDLEITYWTQAHFCRDQYGERRVNVLIMYLA